MNMSFDHPMESLPAISPTVTDPEPSARKQSGQSTRHRSSASYARRRAGNACLVCRSRKTKCDNQRPVCGFCAATGGNCRYVDSDHSQFDQASLAILQRISQLESSLRDHIDEALRLRPASTIESRDVHSSSLLDVDFATEARSKLVGLDMLEPSFPTSSAGEQINVHDLERSSLRTPSEDMPISAEILLEASEMNIDSILRWPIFSQIAPQLIEDIQTPITEVLASKSTAVHGGSKLGTVFHNLSPDTVSHLVENFLANNHVKNPILDVETLQIAAREFSESGPQWEGRDCLMLLVCAISSLSSPLGKERSPGPSKSKERITNAEAYFQASQRRIGMLYHENSLMAAQCSFLTAVYLMSTMRIFAAWKCFVQAATQCLAWLTSQGRVATRDRTQDTIADHETAKQRHVEESLYWSCLKSEMEVRFELGLPGSGLSEIHYANVYPSPPVDISVEQSYNTPDTLWSSPRSYISAADRQNLETGWFFYLAEIATKRIVTNAFKWRYKPRREHKVMTDQELERGVVEFETQIREWYEALPPAMMFPSDPTIPTTDIMRYILRGHMLDIREIIRHPAVETILTSTSPIYSAQFSPTITRLAQEHLVNAVNRIEANREGYFHRHQGTWLGLRSCVRSAVQLLAIACKCWTDAAATALDGQDLESRYLPTGWRAAVLLVSESTEYWADESPDIQRMNRILKELMRVYEVMAG